MKLCFKSCRRQFIASAHTRIQHIFNENAVSRGGIVDENVRDRADELTVLDNGRAAHSADDAARQGDEHRVGDLDFKGFRAGGGCVDFGNFDFVA